MSVIKDLHDRSHWRTVRLAALSLALLPAASFAAPYTWDASGELPLGDGPGAWNASGGTNWYDGSAFGSWNNSTTSTAIFGVGDGAAGAITVGGITANGITFNAPGSGNYALSSGTITLGGVTPTISVAQGIAPTISSVIAGTAGLTKSGSGQLTLSGANTYSGTTTITGAGSTLVVAHSAGLGATGATNRVIVNSGGVLALEGNVAIGNKPLTLNSNGLVGLRNLSGTNSYGGAVELQLNSIIESLAGKLTVSGSIFTSVRTLTFQGAGDTTVDGVLSLPAASGFVKNGTGRLTLSADSSGMAGPANVNAGALRLTHQNAAGASGLFGVATGAALELEDLSGAGMVVTKGFGNVAGVGINDTGVIRNISGSNTLTAATMSWGGSNRINSDAGSLTIQASVTSTGGVRALALGGAGQTILTGNWTFGTGGFTKDGTGLAVLSGSNEWAGTMSVNGGVVRLASLNAASGGIGATGGTRNLTISGGLVELGFNNFERGLGTLGTQVRFLGDGGFSAYGADRTVNLGGASAGVTWGSGSFVPNGNRLLLNSTHADAQIDFQNPIALGGAIREVFVADNPASVADRALISGVISGSTAGNGLRKTGAGQLILGAVNTYTGATQVDAGGLLVHGSTDAASAVSVAAGAVIGGSGTIHGNLSLAQGAFLAFDPASTLTVGGLLDMDDSFGVESLRNLAGGAIDWAAIGDGTYTLLNTSFVFDATTISNFGAANAFSIGDGRSAYFANGSLQLVIVPEPAGLIPIAIGLALAGWCVRRWPTWSRY